MSLPPQHGYTLKPNLSNLICILSTKGVAAGDRSQKCHGVPHNGTEGEAATCASESGPCDPGPVSSLVHSGAN